MRKTLTLRYGRFSCALIGFQDPFSVIASLHAHLRDLATAAPETTSAEQHAVNMRIMVDLASQNGAQRVEGYEEQGTIVLRARNDRRRREGPHRPGHVQRIFDTTDSHMEDRDSSDRRTAIQHLRAAVTAARADGETARGPAVNEAPYRSDVEAAVRLTPLGGVMTALRPLLSEPRAPKNTPDDTAPKPFQDRL